MTQGIKIHKWLFVKKAGSSIVGCMSWETSYVIFHTGDLNDTLIWQSDKCPSQWDWTPGEVVLVDAFKYGDHLRRVTVTR